MSDTWCEACATGETWDDKAGAASLEEHHSLVARLRAEVARLTRERDELVPCGWWPLYEMGCTVSAADLYLSRRALAKAAGQILADHPDAGVK